MKKMDTTNWKEFALTDLFNITGSKTTPKKELFFNDDEKYPYVTTAGTNNGVFGYTSKYTELGNVLTVDSAVLGSTFYQKYNFTASDHVEKLIPKFNMNEYVALFFVGILNKTATIYRYAYNEKRSQVALQSEKISLPVDQQGLPNYAFMEEYMKKIELKASHAVARLKRAKNTKNKRISTVKWKSFSVFNFFDNLVVPMKLSQKDIDSMGETLVYSSETQNSGVVGYCSRKPDFLINNEENMFVIFGDHTKAMNIATSNFCVMDNVKVLKPKIFNSYIIRFLLTAWRNAIPNLGYARHWGIAKSIKIKLPVNQKEEPDYDYMERYMREKENKALAWKEQLVSVIR